MTSGHYEEIKSKCFREGNKFNDAQFPAINTSVDPDSTSPEDWLWKRPREISRTPKFIVDGTSRFDLIQGALGDCWFVAAAAVLATRPDLFAKVIPPKQSFYSEYVGLFHFHFWRFGTWVEVVVDDRLPVDSDGKLRFGRNRSQPNEFWGALLEKAYAKLHGSYKAIQYGHIRDALVDFTGGLSEDFNLRKEESLPPDLFNIIKTSFELGSLLGCGIWNDRGAMVEEEIWNGLYKGHAYSITSVVESRVRGYHVRLLRLRNPWGRKEWKGAWSDGSEEWKSFTKEEKNKIGLKFEDDGEFWISYEDWLSNFHALDIVHLTPENFARTDYSKTNLSWHEQVNHGKWVKGINAGGCGLLSPDKGIYFTNPQYQMRLTRPDKDDVSKECTCIVSLLQKHYRKRKMNPYKRNVIIGFDVHQVRTGIPEQLDAERYDQAVLKKQFRTRTPLREVSCRLELDPGLYCIIPNTLRANQDAEFMLRIYTYSPVDMSTFEDETKLKVDHSSGDNKPIGQVSSEVFYTFAGVDHVIDARDLRDLVNELSRTELGETMAFGTEACRSLISFTDTEKSGLLDYEEVCKLWDEILFWKKLFQKYDKDKSGCIECFELKKILKDLGITLNLDTIEALAVRYGGKDRSLFFEDFALCFVKLLSLYASFKHFSEDTPGEARLTLNQWMLSFLYT